MQGKVAKYYLTDGRRNAASQGYQASIAFERYLTDCGFRVTTDRDFGITALRWAAMQAGIGIIRKNNFFYKEWRYKTNALNAMLNQFEPGYLSVIQDACHDAYAEVRDMASWVLDQIEEGSK